MKLTNNEIYTKVLSFKKEFDDCTFKLPIKINFFLQKNINELTKLGLEIEKVKDNIVHEFGEEQENGILKISEKNIKLAKQELNNLFEIEQEVDIHMFKLDDFQDVELTYKQMEAIMFMIEE